MTDYQDFDIHNGECGLVCTTVGILSNDETNELHRQQETMTFVGCNQIGQCHSGSNGVEKCACC